MKCILILLVAIAGVLSSPFDLGAEPIDPFFVALRDVQFILNTRENMATGYRLLFNDLASLQGSHFNPNRPTRFLIHGFLEGQGADLNTETSVALLRQYDSNIIFVDWSAGAQTINYIAARNRIDSVGALVAQYMDWLSDQNALIWSRLTVIGFSLGAHAAGMTGKAVTRGRINTIIGLDPAGPLFSVGDPSRRLAAGDAEYVEAIHTNGGLLGYGIAAVIADADFFVNGGSSQPGCLTNVCSHNRVVDLYVESLLNNRFQSARCNDEREATRENCNSSPQAWMGGEPSNRRFNLRGIFSTPTARSAPHGQGSIQH